MMTTPSSTPLCCGRLSDSATKPFPGFVREEAITTILTRKKLMSNHLRFRSGQIQLRKIKIHKDTAYYAGDMLIYDLQTGVAWPMHFYDRVPQESPLCEMFLGIVHQPSAQGDEHPISVDISPSSVYEMDVRKDVYEFGQALAPSEEQGRFEGKEYLVRNTTMLMPAEDTVQKTPIALSQEFTPEPTSTLRVNFMSAFNTASYLPSRVRPIPRL